MHPRKTGHGPTSLHVDALGNSCTIGKGQHDTCKLTFAHYVAPISRHPRRLWRYRALVARRARLSGGAPPHPPQPCQFSNSERGRFLPTSPPPPHTVVSVRPHLLLLPHCRHQPPTRGYRWMLTSTNRERASPLVAAPSVRASWRLRLANYWRATNQRTTLTCQRIPHPMVSATKARNAYAHFGLNFSLFTSLQETYDMLDDGIRVCGCRKQNVTQCKARIARACVHMRAVATHAGGSVSPPTCLLTSLQPATTCKKTKTCNAHIENWAPPRKTNIMLICMVAVHATGRTVWSLQCANTVMRIAWPGSNIGPHMLIYFQGAINSRCHVLKSDGSPTWRLLMQNKA